MCRRCPAIEITEAYRLIGFVFHERSYGSTPAGLASNENRHALFLAARFRYYGLCLKQFTADSPPPGIKTIASEEEKGRKGDSHQIW
jgi:hypothetical protein